MVYGVRNKLIFVKKSIPYYEQGVEVYVQLCLAVCGNGGADTRSGDLFLGQRPEFLRADAEKEGHVSDRELGHVSFCDRLDRFEYQLVYPDSKSVNWVKNETLPLDISSGLYISKDKQRGGK
jgi:hypothetical protein